MVLQIIKYYSIFYLFFTFVDKNYCFLKSNHCDQTAFLIRIILFTHSAQRHGSVSAEDPLFFQCGTL